MPPIINDTLKSSTFVYGTTRTTLPPTPLVGRMFVRIKVNSGTLYVGGNTVTATGATQGIAITSSSPAMDFELDIDVNVYGICASGQTASVSIIEGN